MPGVLWENKWQTFESLGDSRSAGMLSLLGGFQTAYPLTLACDYHTRGLGYCCFLSVSACRSAFALPWNDVIQVSMPRYSPRAIIIFGDIILKKSRDNI